MAFFSDPIKKQTCKFRWGVPLNTNMLDLIKWCIQNYGPLGKCYGFDDCKYNQNHILVICTDDQEMYVHLKLRWENCE